MVFERSSSVACLILQCSRHFFPSKDALGVPCLHFTRCQIWNEKPTRRAVIFPEHIIIKVLPKDPHGLGYCFT
ncbi:hypothetical protein TNCV_1219581 [Trichonephila clavipes]|nr:hypothetical protein TNCV_1219581 [Trichonephila clavipes]